MGSRGDCILVEGQRVRCVVGVNPDEREREQTLVVDTALELSTRAAAHSGRIDHTIDYVEIARGIEALLRFRRYRLLESAAEELAAMAFAANPALVGVELTLRKPDALAGRASAAAISIARVAGDFPPDERVDGDGRSEILYRSAGAELGRFWPSGERSAGQWQESGSLEWPIHSLGCWFVCRLNK
jgi:dihydroneopterin aldolase